ncbi:hypothetical protein FB451DRAFT_1573677 [Mycena latifolia]|nr:hypothetical protein FB451DRAFT_1573677 [Mycena latifolia]
MTIPPIPQELGYAIVEEVEDSKTLKACALVASHFRGVSQRILLSSLSLDTCLSWKYRDFCSLLEESPHVAAYATKFTLRLSSERRLSSWDLRNMFSTLTNVRRFTLRGDTQSFRWGYLTPMPIFDFIQRQNLAELHVVFMRQLPLPVLAILASSAPVISFNNVLPDWDHTGAFTAPPNASSIQQLFLTHCGVLGEVLSQPQFAFCLASLRRVGFQPHTEHSAKVILAAAPTLEHIRIDRIFNDSTVSPLPPLGALRSIDLAITAKHHVQWLSASITSISNSPPSTLREIYLTYRAGDREFQPPHFPPEAMAALDRVLAACPASWRFRWRLEFDWDDDGKHCARFSDFARFVRMELPATHETGRLSVERYWLGGELGEWAAR